MERDDGKRRKTLIRKSLLIVLVTIVIMIVCNVIGFNRAKTITIIFGEYLLYITLYIFNNRKNRQETR